MASEERFGYEWKRYAHISPAYEGQFRNWTALCPQDFVGKDVLDAGCGMGRNSYWPLRWGARTMIAFDNDNNSLASARATLSAFSNVKVLRCDISRMQWNKAFDIILCIGVLHHLRNPKLALKNLLLALRPGGKLVVWVYSYEGNEHLIRYINPIRRMFTSRLPLPLVHALAYFLSIPLFIFVKIRRGPTSYLRQLSTFSFWHLHSIVFDQLIPEVANYWRKEEIELMAQANKFSHFSVIRPQNDQGWILQGTR